MKNYSAFRLDDITPDMKWDNFLKAKAIFDKYNIKPLIGVVPDNRDATLHFEESNTEFWNYVAELQKQGWAVAQHGYQHVYENEEKGLLKINPFSEFAGIDYDKQFTKISNGKKILEDNGVSTDIFMAPGHTYDKNTLLALKECGFKYVTDGYASVPYVWNDICFYPSRNGSCDILAGCNTICFHTNVMKNSDFIELEQFIKNHRTDIVDYKEMIECVPAVARTFKIVIAEKKNLIKFKVKRWIGRSLALQRYMQVTNKGSGVVKKCLRIVGLPYCVVLILQEMWKGK